MTNGIENELNATVEAIIEEFGKGEDAEYGRLAHLAETAASHAAATGDLPSNHLILGFFAVFGVPCSEVELRKLALRWRAM